MIVVVEVPAEKGERPPVGAPVVVQVRDTTYADAPATVVAEAKGRVTGDSNGGLAALELDLPPDTHTSRELTVWAHVDVDEDARVSPGDFVTTASYPVTESDAGTPLRVLVKQV